MNNFTFYGWNGHPLVFIWTTYCCRVPYNACTVVEWPVPDSRTALQRFLGFAHFYRHYICNFSQVAAPLIVLTSMKTRFLWSKIAQAAHRWIDHCNLTYICSAKRLKARQAWWALLFSHFDFSISTKTILSKGCMLGAVVWGIECKVKKALTPAVIPGGYLVRRLFTPRSVCPVVLCRTHSSKLVAHPGVKGTLTAASQCFWWPAMAHNIFRHVLSCPVCIQSKPNNSPLLGFLWPLKVPSGPLVPHCFGL